MSRPAPPRPPHPLGVALLFGLLVLAQAQSCLAVAGIVWRALVLSWDSPTTQMIEETASQAVPHTDPAREARESAFRLPAPARGPSAAEDPAPPRSLLTSARVTRAPPA